MIVRALRPEDRDVVAGLVRGGMRERWGAAYDPSFNTDADDLWASHVVAKAADVRVVELGGAVVAVGALVPEGDGIGRVVRVAVSSAHRRQGLATAVVDALVDAAEARGLRRLIVATDLPWTDAVALYEACGFQEERRDATDVHLARAL